MDDFQQRVIAAIDKKIHDVPCPLCRTSDWGVQPGLSLFSQKTPGTHGIMGMPGAMPCAALVCKNCGNTHFINLLIYGEQFKGDM